MVLVVAVMLVVVLVIVGLVMLGLMWWLSERPIHRPVQDKDGSCTQRMSR